MIHTKQYTTDLSLCRHSWRKRVLILLSDTGGGHKASGAALQAALEEQFPGQFECHMVDIWTERGIWPFNGLVGQYQVDLHVRLVAEVAHFRTKE